VERISQVSWTGQLVDPFVATTGTIVTENLRSDVKNGTWLFDCYILARN
jgi:hypothetical protein